MKYEAKDYIGDFTSLCKKEEPKVDKTTEMIYKSKKQVLGLISGRWEILTPAQRKHFLEAKEFVEGYESGVIRNWRDYFKGNKI